jgi:hypothetical protein
MRRGGLCLRSLQPPRGGFCREAFIPASRFRGGQRGQRRVGCIYGSSWAARLAPGWLYLCSTVGWGGCWTYLPFAQFAYIVDQRSKVSMLAMRIADLPGQRGELRNFICRLLFAQPQNSDFTNQ